MVQKSLDRKKFHDYFSMIDQFVSKDDKIVISEFLTFLEDNSLIIDENTMQKVGINCLSCSISAKKKGKNFLYCGISGKKSSVYHCLWCKSLYRLDCTSNMKLLKYNQRQLEKKLSRTIICTNNIETLAQKIAQVRMGIIKEYLEAYSKEDKKDNLKIKKKKKSSKKTKDL